MLVGTGGVLAGMGWVALCIYIDTVLGLGPHCYSLRAKAQTILILNRAQAQTVTVCTIFYSLIRDYTLSFRKLTLSFNCTGNPQP